MTTSIKETINIMEYEVETNKKVKEDDKGIQSSKFTSTLLNMLSTIQALHCNTYPELKNK